MYSVTITVDIGDNLKTYVSSGVGPLGSMEKAAKEVCDVLAKEAEDMLGPKPVKPNPIRSPPKYTELKKEYFYDVEDSAEKDESAEPFQPDQFISGESSFFKTHFPLIFFILFLCYPQLFMRTAIYKTCLSI